MPLDGVNLLDWSIPLRVCKILGIQRSHLVDVASWRVLLA